MREILFRGIDEGTKEWVYGYYFERPSEFGGEKRYYIFDDQTISKYNVFPETVGQYTGLTDKNGKKIFEGDIIYMGLFPYVVKYDRENARYMLYSGDAKRDGFNVFTMETHEVSGNIHDNPELLKGGE